LGDEFGECGAALLDQLEEPHALARSCGRKLGHGLREQRAERLDQRLRAAVVVADHARPAQHVEHVHGRVSGYPCGHFAHPLEQPIEGFAVDEECSLGALGRTVVDRAVDLAALEIAGEALAQFALDRAQLLGQAEPGLEVAVVDAAQLAGERAPGPGGFATGEAGHAGNHAVGC
jgi:hypothetical protein